MSRYTSEQTAYSSLKKKYVPLWKLDTNTVTFTHFDSDTQTEESKTYNTDFIRYHLHFSDSHCPDRIRRLVNDGRIVPYLDDMERKVSEAISRQVELWKQCLSVWFIFEEHRLCLLVQPFIYDIINSILYHLNRR